MERKELLDALRQHHAHLCARESLTGGSFSAAFTSIPGASNVFNGSAITYVDAVKEIENKYNIYVYHCLLSHTEFGDWLSMLFVSSTPDKWAEEKSKLMTGFPEAYVYDFSNFGSEFGDIQIAGVNGGLTRVN